MVRRRTIVIAALVLAGLVSVGKACDTPVYRYAMYRWPAANYFVFHIHEGQPTAAQRKVNEKLVKLEESEPPRPNVAFYDVAVEDIDTAPKIATDHWKRIGQPKNTYIVIAPPPLGGVIYAGDLTPQDVVGLTESPLRTQVAALLEEGMATVFVVLESSGKPEKAKSEGDSQPSGQVVTNDAAARLTQAIVDDVREGRLDLYRAPQPGEPVDAKDLKPKHQIATLRLKRDNPEEKWLVRMLLAVEPDLHEFDQPMAFPVYGRGRVHPPLIGLGISSENLGETVQFLTGACSCTVKEENPGVDLLISYDWESAAIAMAEKFGVEEGNEQLGAVDLFPELIIPGGETPKEIAQAPAADPETTAGDNAAVAVAADKADGGEPADAAAAAPGESTNRQIARAEDPTTEAKLQTSYSMFVLGGVLVAGLVCLFVATLVILRPR